MKRRINNIYMLNSNLPDDAIEVNRILSKGQTRKAYSIVGEDYVKKARGMVFMSEVTKTGVVFAGRWEHGNKEMREISINLSGAAGIEGPMEALRKLIDRLYAMKRQGEE